MRRAPHLDGRPALIERPAVSRLAGTEATTSDERAHSVGLQRNAGQRLDDG